MYYIERENVKWAEAKEKLVNFFFPMSTYCIICGKAVDETRTYPICDHCIKRVRWGLFDVDLDSESYEMGRDKTLDSASVCMRYGIYEKRLVFELKYAGKTYAARAIAKIMEDRIKVDTDLAEILLAADYIVPVPISPDRYKTRGFNQTEKVGKHLSKRIDVPFLDALFRARNTMEQTSVKGIERYANLSGAFKVKPGLEEMIVGKSIILLDDVYTTGSTANRCAAVLKEAGAHNVYLLALASSNDYLLEKNTKIE